MKHEVIIRDTDDLDRAAAEFLEKIGDNTLVAFLRLWEQARLRSL